MKIVASEIGIDASKRELLISIDDGRPFAVKNDEPSLRQALERLPQAGRVHIESSGGHERLAARLLREAGHEVVTHNPLKTRRLAQAQGVRAKTDPVDARMLSRSGALIPACTPKTLERQALSDHSRAIESVKTMIAELKMRMQLPELDLEAKALYEQCAASLKDQLKKAEAAFQKRILESSYAECYELCRSVPGAGPATARVVVCELPEDFGCRPLGHLSSYAGLAPIDDSSGLRQRTKLGKGNHRLKKAMYMPAIWSVQNQPWAKDLYARLRAKGRPHQSAIVAVMRRLLMRIVEVLQRRSAWQAEPPNP